MTAPEPPAATLGLLAFALMLLGALWPPAPSRAASGRGTGPTVIEVPVGVHRNIAIGARIRRVAVGNPDISSAQVLDGSQLLVLGRAPGETSLLVWTEGSREAKTYRLVVPIRVRELGLAVKRDPELSGIEVEVDGDRAVLGGYAPNAEAYGRAIALAKSFAGDNFIDRIKVLQRQMVSVAVRFAALSTSTLKKLGFDFQFFGKNLQVAVLGPNSGASFDFAAGSGLTVQSGLPIAGAFNLLLSVPGVDFLSLLGALSTTRLAQVLAEPTLIVRSGENAEFLAGGEIPVPVPGENNAVSIEYRRFGIQLRLAATVLSPERIVLRVSPQVSSLDFSRAVSIAGTSVPAFNTRSATTTVELGSGQSFILAGLMSSSIADSDEKLPLLGDLPVIGSFFRRVNNTRERQELIIVVSPRLVSPLKAEQVTDLPGERLKTYNPTFGDILLGRNSLGAHLARHGLLP